MADSRQYINVESDISAGIFSGSRVSSWQLSLGKPGGETTYPFAAILFDLDGTLIDCLPAFERAFVEALTEIGLKLNETNRKKIVDNLETIFTSKSNLMTEFMFIWRTGRLLGLDPMARLKLVLSAKKKISLAYRNAPAVAGVREALASLRSGKELALGIVTTRSRSDAVDKLRQTGLLEFFDIVVSRDDVSETKPSPTQIRVAARKLNLPTERCVIVGDMPMDITAGREAGATTVGVRTGIFTAQLEEKAPDFLLDTAADVPSIVGQITARFRSLSCCRS